jgi:hypothetical protein
MSLTAASAGTEDAAVTPFVSVNKAFTATVKDNANADTTSTTATPSNISIRTTTSNADLITAAPSPPAVTSIPVQGTALPPSERGTGADTGLNTFLSSLGPVTSAHGRFSRTALVAMRARGDKAS